MAAPHTWHCSCGTGRYFSIDAAGVFDLCDAQIIRSLKIKPGAGVAAEMTGQPQRGIRGDSPVLADNIVNVRG